MYTVLITDNLSKAGLEILQNTPGIKIDNRSGLTPEQVREALKEADGIIIRSGTTLTPEILKDQPRLKVIVRAGVGVDNIDLGLCCVVLAGEEQPETGITVASSTGFVAKIWPFSGPIGR